LLGLLLRGLKIGFWGWSRLNQKDAIANREQHR
jgi:hypothetical protein